MATIKWINGKSASYLSTTGWSGGVAPGAADTAVISSAGDAAPTKSGQLLVPATGSSKAYLAGLTLDTLTQHQTTNTAGVTETYFTTLAPSQVPAGETVSGGVIDLIAGGSEAALYLQNSTLGAKTTLNVNGDAYVSAGYSDTLAGAINIGLPFSVNGVAQPQPKADAFGHTSALYLDLQAWGSWTGANVPASYIPGINNTGTITIGGGAAMMVAIHAETASLLKTGLKTETSLPPESSQFDNNGAIKVEAGGLFNSYVTNGNGIGQIVNNGTFYIHGGSGKLTEAVFATNVTGHGLINLQGDTQTNPAQTVAQFDAQVAGNSFLINDGGLLLQPGQFDVKSSGFTYSGGTVTFGGHSGILEIIAPIENTVAKLFGDTIAGFESGDTINLHYYMIATGTWSQQLVWTQSTHTLQLYNVLTNGGVQTKSLEASFTVSGTYASSSFHVSNASWNGEVGSAASLVISTTQTSATAAATTATTSAVVGMVSTDVASGDQATLASHLAPDSLTATFAPAAAHTGIDMPHLDYGPTLGALDAPSLHDHGALL
ncbi:MAG TPA: hypothetical protein VGI79_01570 [Caulobacteraceae bacterium]|jgi:hypothetical protein